MEAKAAAAARPVRQGPAAFIAIAVLLILFLLLFGWRWFLVQPFRVPAGSMRPTIGIGQHVLVTKWAYGYSRYSFAPFDSMLPAGRWLARAPQRGDLVVFRPAGETRDFVKRLVGMPGDRIQMIDGVLHINGAAVRHERRGNMTVAGRDGETESVPAVRETLPNGVSYIVLDRYPDWDLDNTRAYVVPAGNYFMLGDDRDFSQDSRTVLVGFVPYDNLIGRVDTIF
jgi:signal peptidase I